MNAHKHIAATVLLAALTVPVLTGCGPSEQEQRDTAAAEQRNALAVRERAHDAYSKCVASGEHPYACEVGNGRGQDKAAWQAMYPGSCAEYIVYPDVVRDPKLVQACANSLRVTPAATAPPSSTPTSGFTPIQVAPSPAPWLIGGGLLTVLLGGAVVGGRALMRRIPAPAHGRYSMPTQPTHAAPEPQHRPDTPENPWA